MNQSNRRAMLSLVAGGLLALQVVPVAQAAGGPCDPPAFCPPSVRPFDGPNGPSTPQQPASAPQPQPQRQQPAPPAQQSQPQPSQSQQTQSQRASNASSAAANPSLKVSPGSAAVGSPIIVTGSGFSIPGRSSTVFVNVKDASGTKFDTHWKEIKCVETDDIVLIYYQMWGAGCTADGGGPMIQTSKDGNFRAAVTVPDAIRPGAGSVCAWSTNGEACTPFTITAGGPAAAPQPQNPPPASAPAPQPQQPNAAPPSDTAPAAPPAPAPAIDPATAATLQQALQSFNDAYARAVANQDGSLLADVVTSDLLPAAADSIQKTGDSGVVSTQLQSVDWGQMSVNGTTAQVSDHEVWNTTYNDGSADTQDASFVYSLALDGGTWKVQGVARQ